MQEARASPKPSQAEPANDYEVIQLETSDFVSEQGINASIQYDSPLVPESPNAAFNFLALLGMDDETIEYTALVDSTQSQIQKVTSHDDSVNKDESHNDKAQGGRDLANGETDAIGTSHVYKPNLSAERDWVKPKNHLKKRATGLDQEARARSKRSSRLTIQLNATNRVLNSRKRWLQYLQELENRVRDLGQKLDEIYRE